MLNRNRNHIEILAKDKIFPNFKELISGTFSALSIRTLAILTSYVFTLFVSRKYGPSSMGYFALSQSVLMALSSLARLGLDSAAIKFVSTDLVSKNINQLRFTYFKMLKLYNRG